MLGYSSLGLFVPHYSILLVFHYYRTILSNFGQFDIEGLNQE